ncbi:hypothetical protein GCM10010275_25980 [Streptomyces litmocidini]|nr:hypothetical protein GCM10010275_25980 [Streptomyces litmocidini]
MARPRRHDPGRRERIVDAALAPRIGPVTARALVALMDGIGLQVLLTGAP